MEPAQTAGVYVCKADARSFTTQYREDGSVRGSTCDVTPNESAVTGSLWTRDPDIPSVPFSTPHDEVFVVLEGRMDLELVDTGEVISCGPGDVIFHAKGVRVKGTIRESPFKKFGATAPSTVVTDK